MPILSRALRKEKTFEIWPKGIEERVEREHSDQVRIARGQSHREPNRVKVPESVPSFGSEGRVPS